MKTLPTEDWKTLLDEYRPEIIDLTISGYEHWRNHRLPKNCVPYKVDRKRYDDAFWGDVVVKHFCIGYTTSDITRRFQHITGGKSPWPEMLLKAVELIQSDSYYAVPESQRSDLNGT